MTFPTIIASYLTGAPQDTIFYKAATWVQANFQPTGPNIVSDIVGRSGNGDRARCSKIMTLSVAKLLGKAIKSIHEESSVSSLFV